MREPETMETMTDPAADAMYRNVWHSAREDNGEKRFARAMIELAVQDGAIEWFSTELAEVMCEAVGLGPEAVVREMRRRRKAA